MTTTGQRMTALLQDMVQDRQRYISLKNLLEEQRTLLLERNSEKLEKMSEQLLEIYNLLAESAERRATTLVSLGVTASIEGVNKLFSHLDVEKKNKISVLLNDIHQQAKTCQLLNERNGMVLQMQMDTFNNIMATDDKMSGIYHSTQF
ncbi:flagellar protein FlgN [Buttiauxella noackiae]|uniref:flagellar protein FlgN n=1 Tax=Buttiauxella noackiae TaxID=82992 RepID=UPI002357F093|nr:flagellar protein FlgN [Buttiauxella noackiae]MCA1923120.1 flagellar protein FlgN [Buttiauxella noackiae]